MEGDSSRMFLSGEGDPEMLQNRLDRCSILSSPGISTRINIKKDNAIQAAGDESKIPLIQVIGDESLTDNTELTTTKDEREEKDVNGLTQHGEDFDEMPPPLSDFSSSSNTIIQNTVSTTFDTNTSLSPPTSVEEEGPSLMETMMAEAQKAKIIKINKENKSERVRSATSFADGLKKGFLSSSKTKSKTSKVKKSNSLKKGFLLSSSSSNITHKKINEKYDSTSKKTASVANEKDIYEQDKDGNIIQTSASQHDISDTPPPLQPQKGSHGEIDKNIPTLRPKQPSNSTSNDSLRLDEVQEAMKGQSKVLHHLEKGEWATPDFMDKLSKNPRLVAGLSNPKFTAALEGLQKNPRHAMKEMQKHAEIMDYMTEFLGVMGEHFTQLGATSDCSSKGGGSNVQEMADAKYNMGPLIKKALKKHNSSTSNDTQKKKTSTESSSTDSCGANVRNGGGKKERNNNNSNRRKQEEDERRVQKIVQDQELTKILMDPNFQRIMEECGIPGRMNHYMHHPEYGPKLRRLIDSGLLKVEH